MKTSIVTLGTFDGVHRGHRALLSRVRQRARATGSRSVALAFDVPPRHAGEPRLRPVLLTTLAEKLEILRRLGIDRIEVLHFDRRTARTSPEDFFSHTIRRKLKAREMVVGPKVAFGRHRAGRLPLLQALGRSTGVRIHVVPEIGGRHGVSSRRIRTLLERGRPEAAAALLGYPYSVKGRVVRGERRGRQLGFPTANIASQPGKILPPGVFWVKVLRGSAPVPMTPAELKAGIDGLCNVGTRPTFHPGDHRLACEVFLFGRRKGKNLYGRDLRVVFLRRIRAEKRFSSGQALSRQIRRDLARARRWAGA